MRVLVVHNAYLYRGGEDVAVESEVALLRSRGYQVEEYLRDNAELAAIGAAGAAAQTLWSRRTAREVSAICERLRPDVIHAHNTFPLVSPSVYWAAARIGIPVVQTLHNFRLLCPQATLLRDGRVCEDCVGRLPWRGVARRCYRDSLPQTAVVAAMITLHRALGTWAGRVTRYIALNEFCRAKFVEGGLPAARIATKPNFADVPAPPQRERRGGLFVGRLFPEKGIAVLAAALASCAGVGFDVIGEGPEARHLARLSGVRLAGAHTGERVLDAMGAARYLVIPSVCHESFPRTLVEAFACSLPVIASRLGAMAELVDDGRTGLLFEPGNAEDLAAKVQWAEANPEAMRCMGEAARCEYEAKYTPEINYRQLKAIYQEAIAEAERAAA